MVLGSSKWLEENAPEGKDGAEVRIPLSNFPKQDISLTHPDSMISRWFGMEKPAEYYLPDYHGKIFTLPEIISIVNLRGMPEESWETNLPGNLAPYIEARVWNHKPLIIFMDQMAL